MYLSITTSLNMGPLNKNFNLFTRGIPASYLQRLLSLLQVCQAELCMLPYDGRVSLAVVWLVGLAIL